MKSTASTFAMFALTLVASAQGDEDGWARVGGHAMRRVDVDVGAIGVSVAWNVPAADDHGAARALAHAAAMHRAACADRALPARARTQVEIGEGFCLFSAWLPEEAAAAAPVWLTALCGLSDADRDGDLVARSLALSALAADDAQWLYPGESLQCTLRRAAFEPGDPRAFGLLGDAKALLEAKPAEFVASLAAPPPGGLTVACVGAKRHGDAIASALQSIPSGPAPLAARTGPVRAPDAAGLQFVEHPRIDAHYVACAMPAPVAPLTLARLCAVETMRTRARSRYQTPRGNEALARAPFVQHEALLEDPLLVLFRRGVHGSPADLPRRELEELAGSMVLPTQAAEFASSVAIVRAEHAAPPYTDGQLAALRAAPASAATRARSLVLLARRGIRDAAVRALVDLRSQDVDAELRAFSTGPKFWAGLAPKFVDPLGG